MELSVFLMVVITLAAFFCEYTDSTLGMGYGTTMTPVLLLFGFKPLEIVPVILLSELITGFFAAFLHQREGNVLFWVKSLSPKFILIKLRELGWHESLKRGISADLKVVVVLILGSIVGAISGAFMNKILPKFWVQLYIGVLVMIMGVLILTFLKRKFLFSWFKLGFLGLLASFNKGFTGGGYGPIIASGQILSGVSAKNAVGITSFAEGVTSLFGVIIYAFFIKGVVSWHLAPFIIIGALLSVPLSVKSVKIIPTKNLKLLIGILTLILGSVTLFKLFSS